MLGEPGRNPPAVPQTLREERSPPKRLARVTPLPPRHLMAAGGEQKSEPLAGFPLCDFVFLFACFVSPLLFIGALSIRLLMCIPFICLSTFHWFCVIYLSNTEHLRLHLLSWVGTAKAREMHVENLSEFMLVWHFGKLLPTEYFEHTQQYHKHAHISQHVALFWTSVSGNGENSLVSSSVGLRSSCRDF